MHPHKTRGFSTRTASGEVCPYLHHCLVPRRAVTRRVLQPPRTKAPLAAPAGSATAKCRLVCQMNRPLEKPSVAFSLRPC